MRFFLVAITTLTIAAGCSRGGSKPDPFAGLDTHSDLTALRHMAEVDDGGWVVDFGTPAQSKYTVGDWRSGWVGKGVDGDTTYAHVGMRGRVYFNADAPKPLVARVRLRPHGTQALTPYLNNKQLKSIHLRNEEGFADYDIELPSEHVQAGENYLLLTFGGTVPIDGQDVSVAVDSIWIRSEAEPAKKAHARAYEGLVANVRLGEEERQAIALSRRSTLRYHVQVPTDGVLGFGVGVEGEGEAPFGIEVTADGQPTTQMLSGTATGAWADHKVDLSRFAGEIVRIDLRAESQGAGRLAWNAPRILVPARPERTYEPAKNVVVLVIDTLRADKLRPFNVETRVKTPVIDRFASEGVVFELAQSPENWTKPAVASILTGLHPLTHQQKTGDAALPSSAELLSEHLKGEGFTTGSFIANGYVSDRFGFDQGWDDYSNYIREGGSTEAKDVFDKAGNWIEAHKDERFFAYIQTIDPHVPYDPPGEYLQMYDPSEYSGQIRPRMTGDLLEKAKRNPPEVVFDASDKRRLKALHDGEITKHDHFFGAFLERLAELGLADDTLVVVTSDHGEEFEDHGSWGHGHSVYQELLHVPLLFRLPNRLPAGAKVGNAVSTLDISATVTELLGVPGMAHNEGHTLVGLMLGEAPSQPTVAFSDFQDDRRVITTGRWKLILRGNLTSTMFDLVADPMEKKQLDASAFPIGRRYARMLLGQFLGASNRGDWLSAEQKGGTQLQRENADMDDTIRDQLRALGYAH
ncbi:MAG: sulfatase [Myxococcales bacterium]|nr:MAG: sulfatase [Myxococcales bacterium]